MPTSAPDDGLHVTGLVAGYGAVTVVKGIDLHLAPGEFVCLLGANGVGKTTLLRAIVGAAKVTAGSVCVGGRDVTCVATHRMARLGVAVVPEGRELIAELSVRQNLVLGTWSWNRRHQSPEVSAALDEVYDRFPVLGRRSGQRAGLLSGGEQQMLTIARALMARPRVLLLDEPSLGLAPLLVREVFENLAIARRQGLTILVAEQNAAAALRVTDRAYVMSGGRVVKEGTAEDISSEALHIAFLGDTTTRRNP